jgi:hypothetical protein
MSKTTIDLEKAKIISVRVSIKRPHRCDYCMFHDEEYQECHLYGDSLYPPYIRLPICVREFGSGKA